MDAFVGTTVGGIAGTTMTGGSHRVHISNEAIKHQLYAQRGRCFWCSVPLRGTQYQVDHVVPLARGGTNDLKNLVCTCPHCNMSKGARLPYTEWKPPRPLRM